jgi:hypothetical protein
MTDGWCGRYAQFHSTYKTVVDELTELKMDRKSISVVLNNRQRSDAQMPWAQVQEKLGHHFGCVTLTPAPEFFLQAFAFANSVVICATREHDLAAIYEDCRYHP